MQVDAVETEVEVALDVLTVLLRMLGHEHPSLEVFRAYEPGQLLELERRADVGTGKPHAAVRPLRHRIRQRLCSRRCPAEMKPQQFEAAARVTPHLECPLVEPLEQSGDLVDRRTVDDDAVHGATGSLGRNWSGC